MKLLERGLDALPEEPEETALPEGGMPEISENLEELALSKELAIPEETANPASSEETEAGEGEMPVLIYSGVEEEFADPIPPGGRVRPELVMTLIAALAAALLLVVVVLCLPYFGGPKKADEDPEALIHHYQESISTEAVPETILEPTISQTEPENPTIPPDRNPYGRNDFQYNSRNYLLLQNVDSSPGVDVSAFQGDIDWKKVARSGIEFAIIRLGYRGYESGKLVEDEYARKNLAGAADAGLKVGAYFFSQALNLQEADEEMDYMMKILGEQHLSMPIVLDWEIPTATARTAGMDARTLTDIQHHFIERMMEQGYQPMVYFNWHQSENLYYLAELEHAPFWLALYQDRMTYPWAVDMWQYTDKGRVPGINGNVDLNVYMPN